MRTHRDGVFPWANEFNAVINALAGESVKSGCAPSKGAGNLDVAIAPGVVFIDDAEVTVNSVTKTVAAGGATKRYDLIVVGADGVVDIVQGTTEKVAPDITADHALLAIVEIDASATSIAASNIYDARVLFNPSPPKGRKFTLEALAVTANGGLNDSPALELIAHFDSDPGVAVTDASRTATIVHNVTAGGGSPASQLDLSIAGTVLVSVLDTGRVGIGTTSPESALHLAADGAIQQRIARHSNDASPAEIWFRKSRGTAAGPSNVQASDDLLSIAVESRSTSWFIRRVMDVFVDGAVTVGQAPATGLRFYTNAVNGPEVERLRIDSAGNIGMNGQVNLSNHAEIGPVFTIASTNAAVGPALELGVISDSIVDNNGVGRIVWVAGSTTKRRVAQIFARIDGMAEDACDLEFYTMGGGTDRHVFRLSSGGVSKFNPDGTLTDVIVHIGGDTARPFLIDKSTAAVVAPGAGRGLLRWEAGTNAGTLKLVAYAGTSTTGVTVVDNVGSGN